MITWHVNSSGKLYYFEYSRKFEIKTLKIPSVVNKIVVTNIDLDSLFKIDKENIKQIIIPNTIQYIGDFSFSSFHNLKKIIFQKNSQIKSIGEHAFSDTKIKQLIIPSSSNDMIIKESAFEECLLLENLDIYNTQCSIIDDDAFYGCKSLSKIVLPDSLKEIGERSFSRTCISEVKLPGIEKIGEYAFGFTPLKSIEINPFCKKIKYNFLKHSYLENKTDDILNSLSFLE